MFVVSLLTEMSPVDHVVFEALIIWSMCAAHVHFTLNVTVSLVMWQTHSSSCDEILCRLGLLCFRATEGKMSNLAASSSPVLLVLPKNDTRRCPYYSSLSLSNSVCRVVRTSLVSKAMNEAVQ